MLTVHHLSVSQSERIVWLCEELAIPYRLVRYERDATTRLAPAEYKALHPFETAPVITDGDVVLGESGAIMEYILAKYGHGRLALSPDDPAFADYLFWFHFANGSMVPSAMINLVAGMIGDAQENGAVQALRARSERAYTMIDQRLAGAPYFAGTAFTAGDIIMVFSLTTMRLFAPQDLTPYPAILAYLQRIGARPAFLRAMEKADPQMAPLLT